MAHRSYRAATKTDWGTSKEGGLTIEQINVGCLLRIADATEAMAANHIDLQLKYDSMVKQRDYQRMCVTELQNSIRSYRGVITKLKKKPEK